MVTRSTSDIVSILGQRLRELHMPQGVLARRSGLSKRTVARALQGDVGRVETLMQLAQAMGGTVSIDMPPSARTLRSQQADSKARKLTGMAQGTSALEGQAVSAKAVREAQRHIKEQLLAGSGRRLWA